MTLSNSNSDNCVGSTLNISIQLWQNQNTHCICNGRPSFKGKVMFDDTFSKMLDHVAVGIFRPITAAKNRIVCDPDIFNASTETISEHNLPLCIRIDQQYKVCQEKIHKDIPEGHVLSLA